MTAEKTTDADDQTDGAATGDDASNDDSTLAWGTTGFVPGSDVGLVARETVGLIERDNPSTRERLWGLVSDDAPLDDILDELSSTGLKALPDFGLAQIEGSAVRIVARGRTTISAELTSGSTHEIDASGVRTWIEELVDDVAAITITIPPLDADQSQGTGEAFAVLAGSVPASSLTRRYDVADDHADMADAGAGWVAGGTTSGGGQDDVVESADVELQMVEDIDDPVESAPHDEPADQVEDDAPESGGDSWFDDDAGDSAAIIPPQPAPPEEESPPVPSFVASSAPSTDAPIDITADPEPPDAEPVDAEPADPQPASPQPPPPGAGPSSYAPGGPGSGGPPPPDSTVIVGSDDGPTRGPVSSIFDDDFDEHAAGNVTGALPGDHDGMTVGRAELDQLEADAESAAASHGSQVHGVLAFSNGERIDIDRPVLIGRNPKVAGAVEGGLPHIMKFDGPGQGLSRTHAEVRIEGGAVLIEDLQSTNGTEVQLPGQQRRRLRGGEPVVIVPGTLIDFGDELHCTLESAG